MLAKEANQLPESRRPAICAITAASRSAGMMMMTSVRRISTASVQPRKYPARAPTTTPMKPAMSADHHHDGDGLLGAAHGHGEEVAADPVLAEGVFAPGERPQRGGGHAVVEQR